MLVVVSDGNQDEKNIRWRPIGAHDPRGRQKLLRAVRSGEYPRNLSLLRLRKLEIT